MGQPKHPLYWIYSGLTLLLIPAIIMLIGLYEKSLSLESPLPSIPPKEVMLLRIAEFDSTASVLHLKEVYQATPAPRSGVLSAYRVLTDDEVLAYRLVVVRHDIEPLVVGRDIDGITEATLSVNALVTQWSQAGSWLAESKGAAF